MENWPWQHRLGGYSLILYTLLLAGWLLLPRILLAQPHVYGPTVSQLSDVIITSLANSDRLVYDSGSGKWVNIAGRATFKSYTVVTRTAAPRRHYAAGFYSAASADANLDEGSLTVTYGGANTPCAAHAFLVAGGPGTVDAGSASVVVSGTSITDAGVRTATDTETIVLDITTMTTDAYYETVRKWLGTITFTLTSDGATTFSADINYGLCKYEDFGNVNFILTDFEVVGLPSRDDDGLEIQLLHHKAAGWTYAASGFVSGTGGLLSMNTIHGVEQDVDADEPFAFKRAGLYTAVAGAASEGLIIAIDTTANNTLDYLNAHIGVKYN